MSGRRLLGGLDALLADPSGGEAWGVKLKGKRIGLLANAASVTSGFVPAWRALQSAGFDVRILFGPEHGLTGAAQDMEPVGDEVSSPAVVSLYGGTFEELSPGASDLAGLDVVVSDLPDVGSRYYTFVWTTALVMKACGRAGIPVVLLDRPNPLGGVLVEGNLPEERYLSFVGLYPVPVRHGMTAGEIALYVNQEFAMRCELTVIPMALAGRPGWAHREAIGSSESWVLPSPNMPTPATALVYPGSCLLEGTNLSEGRGTTRPFEIVGAPWLEAGEAAGAANALGLPGVVFRPHVFRPTFQKHAGMACGGVQIHVTDPASFRPFETGLRLLKALRDLDPASFRWRTERYEYRDDVPAIDLLAGTARYRELVDAGEALEPWVRTFGRDLARFAPVARRYRLYRPAVPEPPVLLIVGAHESGKTTLAEKLITALVAEGLKVGSLKHTDHEYDTDIPGKDSHRHAAAGAEPAALVAGRRSAVHRRRADRPALAELLSEFEGCDAVIVEGFRSEALPKIEICRAATGREPLSTADPDVVAVVTDRETPHPPHIPRLSLDDLAGVLAVARETLGLRR